MEKTFTVLGMSCQHCVMAVKKALLKVPGVGDTGVDLGSKSVKVTFDPALVGPEQIIKAIETAGYKVSS